MPIIIKIVWPIIISFLLSHEEISPENTDSSFSLKATTILGYNCFRLKIICFESFYKNNCTVIKFPFSSMIYLKITSENVI